ncbi:rCG37153 [Rattus norvegicus]|uniref:RCG37153 n=1 Tax=Rattus norvegicus TaxID=10116 RepID=A6HTN8_RAT|nr:rCG37153 [Rattus norvegicus]
MFKIYESAHLYSSLASWLLGEKMPEQCRGGWMRAWGFLLNHLSQSST